MKYALLTALCLFISVSTAYGQFIETDNKFIQTRVTYLYPSKSNVSSIYDRGWRLDDTKSIETELMFGKPDGTAAGLGVGYQIPRDISRNGTGDITYIPVYGRLQGTFEKNRFFSLYLGGRIGFNAISLDGEIRERYKVHSSGFVSVVFGCLAVDNIIVESSLSIQNGRLDDRSQYNDDEDLTILQFSLGAGIMFD